jgi:hypothetical protein
MVSSYLVGFPYNLDAHSVRRNALGPSSLASRPGVSIKPKSRKTVTLPMTAQTAETTDGDRQSRTITINNNNNINNNTAANGGPLSRAHKHTTTTLTVAV